jgi:hypothetical protein
MDRYGGPHTAFTIALPGALQLAIIRDRYGGPQTALAWRPLYSHYNGSLWRALNCPYYSLASWTLPSH